MCIRDRSITYLFSIKFIIKKEYYPPKQKKFIIDEYTITFFKKRLKIEIKNKKEKEIISIMCIATNLLQLIIIDNYFNLDVCFLSDTNINFECHLKMIICLIEDFSLMISYRCIYITNKNGQEYNLLNKTMTFLMFFVWLFTNNSEIQNETFQCNICYENFERSIKYNCNHSICINCFLLGIKNKLFFCFFCKRPFEIK
jgi:hypothetical protein